MERPEIKGVKKEVREYIEVLEEKLEAFTADDTIANLYIGLKKQLDDISAIFLTYTITEEDLRDKDDKGSDRYFKYLEKSKTLAENLKYIEKMVAPDKIEQAKRRSDEGAESYVFNHTDEKS